MYLNHEQIIPFVHNALGTQIDDQNRLRFLRFTPEQTADYGLDGDHFPIRCRASANVTLDFITDAEWFGFEYDLLPGSSQPFYSFDLFVDGVLTDSRMSDGFSSSGVLFELPIGTHRVTLFFPWSAEVMLKNMAVSDGAKTAAVPPKKLHILAIGDSITQGYIAKHPGYTWVGKLTRELDAEVLNLGVGGYGFLINSLNHPIPWKPDLIILAYGTNDYGRESCKESFHRCASGYVARLIEVFPSVPILMAMPVYRHDSKHLFREKSKDYTLEEARQILREIASFYPQITVLEDTHYPHAPDFFAPDFLHPNDLGFQIHGEKILQTIKERYL